MSGHSKWANIKHRKGRQDAARSKTFGKLIREITVAARMGGGDANGNARLRLAIDKARGSNMPKDTIERAIAKGTGEGSEGQLEEVTYEGYGANGVAIMVEAITDNRNRTAGEIRHIFTKHGGNLGTDGCVAWMFKTWGIVQVDREKASEERVIEVALDAGADDVVEEGDYLEVRTTPDSFDDVLEKIKAAGFTPIEAEVSRRPGNVVTLDADQAGRILKLLDLLQDHDDVQKVYSNFDVPDEVLEKLSQG